MRRGARPCAGAVTQPARRGHGGSCSPEKACALWRLRPQAHARQPAHQALTLPGSSPHGRASHFPSGKLHLHPLPPTPPHHPPPPEKRLFIHFIPIGAAKRAHVCSSLTKLVQPHHPGSATPPQVGHATPGAVGPSGAPLSASPQRNHMPHGPSMRGLFKFQGRISCNPTDRY